MGLLASGAASADEASLTGIWEGIQVCDDSQAGVQLNFVADDQVEITQRDGHLGLRRVTQDGAASLLYEGTVMALASSERFEAWSRCAAVPTKPKRSVVLKRVRVNEDGSGLVRCREPDESAMRQVEGVADFRHVQVGL